MIPVARPRLLLPFAAVTAVHLACQAAGAESAAGATQVLLMPALAAYLLAVGPRTPLVRLTLLALGLSWLGDSLPRVLDGDPAFLAMVGCFLLAQVAYIAAFTRFSRRSVLHRRPALLLGYAAGVVALLAACLPAAGVLAPAVVVYGVCLGTMAVLATGVHPLAWIGGTVFLVSDSLIALDSFDVATLPGQDVWVMATYTVAQLLLVLGVVRVTAADRPRAASATAADARSGR